MKILSKEDLEIILKTAQRTPTSSNMQQVSLLVIQDQKKIEDWCNQKHISSSGTLVLILVDYRRIRFKKSEKRNKKV